MKIKTTRARICENEWSKTIINKQTKQKTKSSSFSIKLEIWFKITNLYRKFLTPFLSSFVSTFGPIFFLKLTHSTFKNEMDEQRLLIYCNLIHFHKFRM